MKRNKLFKTELGGWEDLSHHRNNRAIYAVDVSPEFMKWWDSEKNPGIDPTMITVGANQCYNFTCPECGETIARKPPVFLRKQADGTYLPVACQKCHPTKSSLKVLLIDAVPDIEQHWDYELNSNIDLKNLGASSGVKVWTRCPICGTSVKRNVRFTWEKDEKGIGHVIHCRICGKRKQDNTLVSLCPDILKYWVAEKNTHTPDYYTISSSKKITVRCPECGDMLTRPVCDSVEKDPDGKYYVCACISCARTVKQSRAWRLKVKLLVEQYPDVKRYWINEMNQCSLDELLITSTEKIYVRCPSCGDPLYRRCVNSFKRIDGVWTVVKCQKCAIQENSIVNAEMNPISNLYPEIVDWWDYARNVRTPENVSYGSKIIAAFRCPECHKPFKRPVKNFISLHEGGVYRPVGCPECGYYPKENPVDNIAVLCPEIRDWWNYEKNAPHIPEEFTKGAQFEAYLTCPDCGMELYTGIHSLVATDETGQLYIRHQGKCRKYRAMASSNNLLANYPEVAEWWDYEKNAPNLPEYFTTGSSFEAYFRCRECGFESHRRITDAFVLIDGTPSLFSYPICADKKVLAGVNDLLTTDPDLAQEWSPNNDRFVTEVRKSFVANAKWICPTCNGEYTEQISERSVGDDACPYCRDTRVLAGYNDLATTYPELAAEWSPNNERGPESVRRTLKTPAKWICTMCKGEYSYPVDERYVGDDACPYCCEEKVLSGYNSFKVKHPSLMSEWCEAENALLGLDPDQILASSNETAWWLCPTCNHKYVMTPKMRVMKQKRGHIACTHCRGYRWERIHFV